MKRLLDKLELALISVASLLLFVVMVVLAIQVYARYVLAASTPWSSEIARYGTVWITMIVWGVVSRRSQEIRVDFLEHYVPGVVFNKATSVLFKILELIFAIVLAFSAVELMPIAGTQKLVGLGMPMTVVIWAFSIGPLLAVPFLLEGAYNLIIEILQELTRRKSTSESEGGS